MNTVKKRVNATSYRETCKRENSNFWIRQTVLIGADTGYAGWFGAVLVYDKGVSTLHGRRSDGDEHSRRHEHEIFHRLHAASELRVGDHRSIARVTMTLVSAAILSIVPLR